MMRSFETQASESGSLFCRMQVIIEYATIYMKPSDIAYYYCGVQEAKHKDSTLFQ